MKPIYEALAEALVARGWKRDLQAKESELGEVLEFIHPDKGPKFLHGKPMAFVDALLAQTDLDVGR